MGTFRSKHVLCIVNPILHYFHSERAGQSPVVSVAILEDALTLLRYGVSAQSRPNETILRSTEVSVEHYLESLHRSFIEPASRLPPTPELEPLRDAGIPTPANDTFRSDVESVENRRRTVSEVVESDERQWPIRNSD